MFSTKEATGESKFSSMLAGVHPAKLDNIVLSDKGDIDFMFSSAQGTTKVREFAIDRTNANWKKENEERAIERITHIFMGWASKSELDAISGTDFKDWASKLVALVLPRVIAAPAIEELKLTYNAKNGFLQIPYLGNFLSTTFHKVNITINPKYDLLVKPDVKADKDNASPIASPQADNDDF